MDERGDIRRWPLRPGMFEVSLCLAEPVSKPVEDAWMMNGLFISPRARWLRQTRNCSRGDRSHGMRLLPRHRIVLRRQVTERGWAGILLAPWLVLSPHSSLSAGSRPPGSAILVSTRIRSTRFPTALKNHERSRKHLAWRGGRLGALRYP